MDRLPQLSERGNLPNRSEKSNLQRALDDRLLFSEATDLAANLLEQFPNSKNFGDGFIGSIASIFTQYPRQVVTKCADPLRGIASKREFLTIAGLVAWLEEETEPLRSSLARELRIAEQFRALDEWKNQEISPQLKAKAEAWLNRTDPLAQQLTSQNNAAEHERAQNTLDQIQAANQKVFMRECEKTGVDPSKGVSPSLLKILREQNDANRTD